jgi:hypothetical protein
MKTQEYQSSSSPALSIKGTQPGRLYELMEQAHKHGYNWRGVWDKMSYTSKMLAVEQICQQGTYGAIFYDEQFQKVIFGKMGEIVEGLNKSWHLFLSSIGSVVFEQPKSE